jgi:hypothetical protein
MPELPRGVPFIDLLVPLGTAAKAPDIQTRLDLVGDGLWQVRADDGTMEDSLVPMQPVRGNMDRIQIYRRQPIAPGEGLDEAAALAVEVTQLVQPRLVAVGVYGVYAWGMVLVEDVRWLHGLVLLDWLYNPRLDDRGEVLPEDDETPPVQLLQAKVRVFDQLWTPTRSAMLAQRLPPGALQPIDDYLALTLLGPGGQFDPRYWQGFSMQVALAEVRAVAGATPDAAPPPVAPAAPEPEEPAVPLPPDDGLTPLARALREAEERSEQAAAAPEAVEAAPESELSGPSVRWVAGSGGPLLVVPEERLEPRLLKRLRESGTEGLARSERPSPEAIDDWRAAGAHFVTEVPFLSRLFLDGKPLHRGSFEAGSIEQEGLATLECHLPRVSRVRAIRVPPIGDVGSRILVCTDASLPASEVVSIAG